MRARILWFALCSLAACSIDHGAPLVATDIVVSKAVPGTDMRAAYIALTNSTNSTIIVDHVASPDFTSVQMHESLIDNGIASMRAIRSLTIQAGQTVRFERGGKHLMLMRQVNNLDSITLQFYSNDALLLSVIAKPEAIHD